MASTISSKLARHPFHSTQAEIEWNSETGRFEVALSLWPIDVETALKEDADLRNVHAGPVDLDDVSLHTLLDPALERYVRQRFALVLQLPREIELPAEQDGSPRRSPVAELEWFGFEVEKDSVWCYFELVPPADLLPAVEQVPAVGRGERPERTGETSGDASSDASGDETEREASEQGVAADEDSRGSVATDGAIRLRFRNELFFEIHPDQENVILLKIRGRRSTLRAAVDVSPAPYQWPSRSR